ncbi:10282_t:CDS:2 [Ambispora leptoticha]|uniref:10282_t:CDS:1 n=1 Tax=Ambispora leptoticha TaxID=144679 RepID=A0A9N9C579_9GLOM|nr:10282_t:CDS:2 [Ambispora leptoticha]
MIVALPYSLEKRQLHTGQGTYFNPSLGACGQYDNDNSLVVALAAPDFDPQSPNGNPNHNSLCNRGIRIYYNNRSVEGIIRDRCPECNAGDVDMSPAIPQECTEQKQHLTLRKRVAMALGIGEATVGRCYVTGIAEMAASLHPIKPWVGQL